MPDRRNGNPDFFPASADEERILQDPRLADMPPPMAYQAWSTRDLAPTLPIDGPSRFLELKDGPSERTCTRFAWVNNPNFFYGLGYGHGLGRLLVRPRFEQQRSPPRKPPQMWRFNFLLIVSPEVRDVLCRFAAQALEFCEIDWVYSDDTKLDGYGFVDIIQLVYGFDYDRSRVRVRRQDGVNSIDTMLVPTVLRADIGPDVHIFREARWRHHIYVSRELAAALTPYLATDMHFTDPHEVYKTVKFPGQRKKSGAGAVPPPAIVYDLPTTPADATSNLSSRLRREIPRLLDAANFAGAEAKLVEWLREFPQSPYHIATEIAITTPPERVAAFLDEFIREAAKQDRPKVLYAEMNGFVINTDLWFFDAFAFDTDGGREAYEWLGDFFAGTDTRMEITGLERLQAVYADPKCHQFNKDHPDAAAITEVLVIVRFQRLLQQAVSLLTRKVPLVASAHDYSEYVVEIKPAS